MRPLALLFIMVCVLSLASMALPFRLRTQALAQVAPTCFGRTATIVGTDGNDSLDGTSGDDVIVGLAGDDIIHGNGGNDFICGGDGNDTLFGDDGANSLSGDAGDDMLIGGPGNDVLLGSDGDDVIDGTGGNDSIGGGTGYDIVSYLLSAGPVSASLATGAATSFYAAPPPPGNPGAAPSASTQAIVARTDSLSGIEAIFGSRFDDTLVGDGAPANLLFGGPGNDTLKGGPGFDYLIGSDGDDIIDGGDGTDFVSYQRSSSPVTVNLANGTATGEGSDTITNVEGVDGSPGDDTIIGDPGTNFFVGESGNDRMDGGAGFDFAIYAFATGPIQADLTSGRALGDGTDSLANIEGLSGSEFDDTLIGDAGDNILFGSAGNDLLDGGGGHNVLDGGDGVDGCVQGQTLISCEHGGTNPPTATPTETNTPANTPTETNTPTATPTETKALLLGDANCDGSVNSIDAALVLQKSAGLIASLPCEENADANGDARVNAVDAALILQYNAGLIHSFPLLNSGGGNDVLDGGDGVDIMRAWLVTDNSPIATNLQLLRRNVPLGGSGSARARPPYSSAASSALAAGSTSGASGLGRPIIQGCFTAAPGPGIGTSSGFTYGTPYGNQPVFLQYFDFPTNAWTFVTFAGSNQFYYQYTNASGCVATEVSPGFNYRMFAYYDAGDYCGVYSAYSQFHAYAEAGFSYDLGTADTTPVGSPYWCVTVIPRGALEYSPSNPYAANTYRVVRDSFVWGNSSCPIVGC